MHIQTVSDLESASKPSYLPCSVSAHGIPPYVRRCHLVASRRLRYYATKIQFPRQRPSPPFLASSPKSTILFQNVNRPMNRYAPPSRIPGQRPSTRRDTRHATASVDLTAHNRLPAVAMCTQAVPFLLSRDAFPTGSATSCVSTILFRTALSLEFGGLVLEFDDFTVRLIALDFRGPSE
jgi:hypothetical protein